MKRTSIWSVLLLTAFILVPLALYFVGIISNAWINRIGIILNFLAGFMVAPDLIGAERLNKAEEWLELKLNTIFKAVGRKSASYFFRNGINLAVFLIHITPWVLLYFFWTSIDKYIAVVIFIIYYIPISIYKAIDNLLVIDFINSLSPKILSLSIFVLFFLVHAILFPLALVLFFIVFGLFRGIILIGIYLLIYLISKLEGEKRLTSIMVFWGVIFFIMGNLMQLVATFEQDKKPENIVAPKTQQHQRSKSQMPVH